MPFDANNYVAPDPQNPGQFMAVVGGVANRGMSQSDAENLYNRIAVGNAVVAPNPAAVPSGVSYGGGISPEHREGLRTAGYGDWANPNLTEADFARISAGAQAAGASGGPFPGAEFMNLPAEQLKLQNLYNQAQLEFQKYQYNNLSAAQKDEMAFRRAVQAWTQDLQERQFAAQQGAAQRTEGLQALNLAAQLRGPANAFANDALLHGLNRMGVPNSVNALLGTYVPPDFQAPQGSPVPASLPNLAGQISAAGDGTYAVGTQPTGGTSPAGVRTTIGQLATPTYGPQAAAFLSALPAPNQINARNFMRLPSSSQQLNLAGYEALGYNPNDVLGTVQKLLPQFSMPAVGSVG